MESLSSGCTFSCWHADVNFHLSAHEQTPVSTALVNEVTCAGVCVLVSVCVCMALSLRDRQICVNYFEHIVKQLYGGGMSRLRFSFLSKIKFISKAD